MLKYLQRFLGGLGKFTYDRMYLMVLFVIIMSIVSAVGFTQVRVESDFSQFDPQDVEVIQLNKRIDQKFPSFSSFLVTIELDDEFESQIDDIRDPAVMEYLKELTEALSREQKIQEITSAAVLFGGEVPEDLEAVKIELSRIPGSDSFFNSRYTLTPVFVSADVSGDSEKIQEITDRVRDIVASTSTPGGVKVSVTGEPPLFAKIFDLLISDAIFTMLLATLVIFAMLLFIQRSVIESVVIIIPVLFGVFWTMGMLGLFNVPITIATAALGAMLLGLGVEYSIFLNSRYTEEKKAGVKEGISKALSTTGASTVSSGITTLIGFFALSLSAFPMLSDLGFSLGTGIALILLSVMVIGPIGIILRERYGKKPEKKDASAQEKEPWPYKVFEVYGAIVSKRTWLVIIVAIVVTFFMFQGSQLINNEVIDFDSILPADLPELVSFNLLSEEFEDTTTIEVFIELDTTTPGSNEPFDIRDPRVIRYVDVLSQKLKQTDYLMRVESLSEIERSIGNGILPSSLREQKELLDTLPTRELLTEDHSGTRIRVIFSDAIFSHRETTILQVYEIVETTQKPAGVVTHVGGGIVAEYELEKFVGPDSSFTAMVAFAIIIVFLFLLSRSIKYTILPLVTVVVAIIWILGMIGYFGVGWNNIVSSVLSMTIGIGIDFGIQLSNRFRQELETHDKRTAMRRTLKYVLYPMIITVIAALIGFSSMSFGQLQVMGDLGTTMSFSMVASMIVAVSLVAGLMLVFERSKKRAPHKSLKEEKSTKKP